MADVVDFASNDDCDLLSNVTNGLQNIGISDCFF